MLIQNASGKDGTRSCQPLSNRVLTEGETVRVRKMLACATRMKGRFGKNLLASTLRGSAAKNVRQAHLNELSTYGLLKDMRQDDILLYIEALCVARCLRVSSGEYPTVSITELGDRVMRGEKQIELALPEIAAQSSSQSPDPASDSGSYVTAPSVAEEDKAPAQTIFQTYALYRQGFSVEEIAHQRNCTTGTIESHLVDCVRAGLAIDVSKFVSVSDRAQIETAMAEYPTKKLKPIHDSLPESITYNMIRFVIADRRRLEKAAK
jgi:superfamily II DNA helicase RecQ